MGLRKGRPVVVECDALLDEIGRSSVSVRFRESHDFPADNAGRKDIHFGSIMFAQDNFRSHVSRGTSVAHACRNVTLFDDMQKATAVAGGFGSFFPWNHFFGQSKVKQLECPVLVKANVGWFDI
jgi:hypothetical protein